jgi:hypothetical protein
MMKRDPEALKQLEKRCYMWSYASILLIIVAVAYYAYYKDFIAIAITVTVSFAWMMAGMVTGTVKSMQQFDRILARLDAEKGGYDR